MSLVNKFIPVAFLPHLFNLDGKKTSSYFETLNLLIRIDFWYTFCI